MLKKLQLYTICIFVVVIVLSQFTLISEHTSLLGNNDVLAVSQPVEENNEGENTGLIGELKNSKYAKPFEEVQEMVNSGNTLIEDIKKGIESLKDMMDIEKSIDEMTKNFQ